MCDYTGLHYVYYKIDLMNCREETKKSQSNQSKGLLSRYVVGFDSNKLFDVNTIVVC